MSFVLVQDSAPFPRCQDVSYCRVEWKVIAYKRAVSLLADGIILVYSLVDTATHERLNIVSLRANWSRVASQVALSSLAIRGRMSSS